MHKYVTFSNPVSPTGDYIDFGFGISKENAYTLQNLQEKLHDAVAARLPKAIAWLYPVAIRVRLLDDRAKETAVLGEKAMRKLGLEVETIVNEVLNQPEFLGPGQL